MKFRNTIHNILQISESEIEDFRKKRNRGISKKRFVSKEGDVEVIIGWERAPTDGEYSSSWFVLIEKEEKLDYLWVLLKNQVESLLKKKLHTANLPPEMKARLPKYLDEDRGKFAMSFSELCLKHKPKFSEDEALGSFVDIDSQLFFPLDSTTGFPHVEFLRWFKEKICSPNVIIIGGNDIDYRIEDLPDSSWRYNIPQTPERDRLIALDRDDHWLLWCSESGLKIRMSKFLNEAVKFSSIPESIELKITERSDAENKSEDQSLKTTVVDPWDLSEFIQQTGALEVIVNGPEPLKWIDFWLFADRLYKKARIVLVTKEIESIPHWKLGLVSCVELVVDSVASLKKTLKNVKTIKNAEEDYLVNAKCPWFEKLIFRVVLGSMPMDDIIKVCDIAHKNDIKVVFLDPLNDSEKTVEPSHSYDDWINRLKSSFVRKSTGVWYGPKIGVDFIVAKKWKDEFTKILPLDSEMPTEEEGSFSIFVDTINFEYSKSSYERSKRKIKNSKLMYGRWKPEIDSILQTYNSWHSKESELQEE
jgi:hypothetical protein